MKQCKDGFLYDTDKSDLILDVPDRVTKLYKTRKSKEFYLVFEEFDVVPVSNAMAIDLMYNAGANDELEKHFPGFEPEET